MALLRSVKNNLLIAFDFNILLYDLKHHRTSRLDFSEVINEPFDNNLIRESTDGDNKLPGNDNDENGSLPTVGRNKIRQVAVSNDENRLAVTTVGYVKALYLYDKISEQIDPGKFISKRYLSRTSSAIRFSPDDSMILIADKTGDCYIYSCVEMNEPGRWILGHFSMVLDILFTGDQKYILTCDRDEKIRLTRYPETCIIETYCLGHQEYVSSLELLSVHPNRNFILSVSGDKTARLWNYGSGIEFLSIDMPGPGIQSTVSKGDGNIFRIGISLYESPHLFLIDIEIPDTDNESFNYKIIECECSMLKTIQCISSVIFKDDRIFLATIDENSEPKIISLRRELTGGYVVDDSLARKINSEIVDSKEVPKSPINDISLLFKKKFDNVAEYHERKRRRIEGQDKK